MQYSADEILAVLDEGARAFTFPMLDNGYVYPAATRLSLYRSEWDWAVVIELFGFSPRAGLPDLLVCTFGSHLTRQKGNPDFISEDAYQQYLQDHPNDELVWFHPLAEGDWMDQEDLELVDENASTLCLRGEEVPLPALSDYADAGVEFSEAPRITVFELCRALAFRHRSSVLATEEERRVALPSTVGKLLTLDEWHHPDVADPEALPSRNETFRQLTSFLVGGDVAGYAPAVAPNTHWSHWPAGGTL
jgi:hypothetical protein